jgi:hypothetical protein
VTTEPSFFRAAKESKVEYTAMTPELREDATAAEFPPYATCPQVTTEPSVFSAANACEVAVMVETPELNRDATALESPP